MNMDNKALLRKYTLNILQSGQFIIVYVFWQFLRFTMSFFFKENIVGNLEISQKEFAAFVVFYIIFFAILYLIFSALHIYVGVMAIRFSKSTKKKSGYLTASFILLFFSIIQAFNNFSAETIDDTVIASFILDVGLCFIIAVLIYSTIRVKRLNKLQEKA